MLSYIEASVSGGNCDTPRMIPLSLSPFPPTHSICVRGCFTPCTRRPIDADRRLDTEADSAASALARGTVMPLSILSPTLHSLVLCCVPCWFWGIGFLDSVAG